MWKFQKLIWFVATFVALISGLNAEESPESAARWMMYSSVRPRIEGRFGHQFGLEEDVLRLKFGESDSHDVFSQRTRVGFEYQTASLQTRMTLQHTYVWGDLNSTTFGAQTLRPYEAWINFEPVPWMALRAGRQEVRYGKSRVLAAPDWGQLGRTWDGLRLRLALPGPGRSLDVFAMRNEDGGGGSEFLEGDGWLGGVYASLPDVMGFSELEFYVLGDAKLSRLGGDMTHRRLIGMGGLRAEFKLAGFWTEGEGGFQLGSRCDTDLLGVCTPSSTRFLGWFGELQTGYGYGAWRGHVSGSVASESYVPMYPSAHTHLGWMDLFTRTNLVDIHAMLAWSPGPRFELKVHEFKRLEPVARRVGLEVDARVIGKPLKDLQLEGGFGVLFPDAGVAVSGTPSGVATWMYAAMTWSM